MKEQAARFDQESAGPKSGPLTETDWRLVEFTLQCDRRVLSVYA